MHKITVLLATALGLTSLAALSPADNALASAAPPDTAQARFELCAPGPRVTCVVDGDTFWLNGLKIRIADINTPETSQPACVAEARLGMRATHRLVELLNAGPFELEVQGRGTDRYGRALRVVTRNGRSLGAILEAEGLAELWKGRRSSWCEA
ncbi:thermonuclease family protein [Novosphingobium sp. CCH12-A3]|uniref:thermonuclease family protein n=1 Tax=Novosphingobium sp. CCH12-A3 TaxID=1768752 RepID=UPI0007804AFB|nr:thermonuclease family protein [Novosphingobium sp. CCH12-A3]